MVLLAGNTSLRELYTGGHPCPPETASAFSAMLRLNRGLRSLCIGDSGFGDAGVAALVPGLSGNSTLERLDLEGKARAGPSTNRRARGGPLGNPDASTPAGHHGRGRRRASWSDRPRRRPPGARPHSEPPRGRGLGGRPGPAARRAGPAAVAPAGGLPARGQGRGARRSGARRWVP